MLDWIQFFNGLVETLFAKRLLTVSLQMELTYFPYKALFCLQDGMIQHSGTLLSAREYDTAQWHSSVCKTVWYSTVALFCLQDGMIQYSGSLLSARRYDTAQWLSSVCKTVWYSTVALFCLQDGMIQHSGSLLSARRYDTAQWHSSVCKTVWYSTVALSGCVGIFLSSRNMIMCYWHFILDSNNILHLYCSVVTHCQYPVLTLMCRHTVRI
jgi:hypothetical protein